MNCRVLKKGKCEITQNYSQNHSGIDLVGENYTLDEVVSHSDGEIIEVIDGYNNNKGSNSYGNYIKVDHQNGFITLYAHLEKGLKVKKGTNIKKDRSSEI